MATLSGIEIDIRLKRFPAVGEAPAHVALEQLRFTVERGELVCILGPSGCGKTTLLNIIAGLDRDYGGAISMPVAPGRREPVVGYVFQTPRLLPWRTVVENVELVLTPAQIRSGIVAELLAATGLQAFPNTYPERLSVGMTRRVALVRAFAIQPDLLLMDEPFISLDEPTAQRSRLLLLDIWRSRPSTVLFVTHDLREAIMLADRILLLSPAPGRLVASVPVDVPRDRRQDAAAIEQFRQRLFESQPESFRDL